MELDLWGPVMALPHFGCRDPVGASFMEDSPSHGPLGHRSCSRRESAVCDSFSNSLPGPAWRDLQCMDFLILSIRAIKHTGGWGDSQVWYWPEGGIVHQSWRQQGTAVKSQWV